MAGLRYEIFYRLSNIMCSSICTTDEVCNAYQYSPKNCSLANATGLVGADLSSANAEVVMINAKLVAGKIYIDIILASHR